MTTRQASLVQLAAFLACVVLLGLMGWLLHGDGASPLPPQTKPPIVAASPIPEPFDPPPTEPEEPEPPLLGKVRVCCYGMAPYGPGREREMSRVAARLHTPMGRPEHTHDLIGRGCASTGEEDLALRRVLFRPERIEGNAAATLSQADRAARRERELGGM